MEKMKELLKQLKEIALKIGEKQGSNLKLELDVSPSKKSVKLKKTEYDL